MGPVTRNQRMPTLKHCTWMRDACLSGCMHVRMGMHAVTRTTCQHHDSEASVSCSQVLADEFSSTVWHCLQMRTHLRLRLCTRVRLHLVDLAGTARREFPQRSAEPRGPGEGCRLFPGGDGTAERGINAEKRLGSRHSTVGQDDASSAPQTEASPHPRSHPIPHTALAREMRVWPQCRPQNQRRPPPDGRRGWEG